MAIRVILFSQGLAPQCCVSAAVLGDKSTNKLSIELLYSYAMPVLSCLLLSVPCFEVLWWLRTANLHSRLVGQIISREQLTACCYYRYSHTGLLKDPRESCMRSCSLEKSGQKSAWLITAEGTLYTSQSNFCRQHIRMCLYASKIPSKLLLTVCCVN